MKSKILFATVLAGALALPALGFGEEKKPSKDGDKVPCWGVNKCKGVGDCGSDGCRHSGCSGSNACNGQGFIRLDPKTCLRIVNGRLTKAVPKGEKKAEK
jgi:uncharacterized membrane protein